MPNALGHVIGRYVSHDDAAASGEVVFVPVTTTRLLEATPPADAVARPVTATLDEAGEIHAALIPAAYDVSFRLRGVTRPPFRVAITAEHTQAAPLNLTEASPVMPSPVLKYVANEETYREAVAAVETAETAASTATARASAASASASAASAARDDAATARTEARAAATDAEASAQAAATDAASLRAQWAWTVSPEDPDVLIFDVPDTWLHEEDDRIVCLPMPTPRYAPA